MAPKKGKRGKKGKGRRKKKGKKKKVQQDPPPLHLLTELYKKLENAIRELYEMRVAARKKRLEGWFMTREMVDIKNDNQLYHDYLEENIDALKAAIEKLMKLIKEERDAINKAIEELLAKLEQQRLEYEAQASAVETQLQDVRQQLLEFEPMMEELARLMAILEGFLKEIEAAEIEATMKIRHLTNQFLDQRSRLHNHLEEQLFNLIKHCRTYVMPILWNFMQGMILENQCLRWKLARTDEKNIMLAEKRDELMNKRKLMALEKPYWNIEWAFFKLAEIDAARNRRLTRLAAEQAVLEKARISSGKSILNVDGKGLKAGSPSTPSSGRKTRKPSAGLSTDVVSTTQLGRDFNTFLKGRLEAAAEAQERQEREKRREERRFLRKVLRQDSNKDPRKESTWKSDGPKQSIRPSQAYSTDLEFYKMLLEEEKEWEDFGEDEDEDEDEERGYGRRQQSDADEEGYDEETDYEDDEEEQVMPRNVRKATLTLVNPSEEEE